VVLDDADRLGGADLDAIGHIARGLLREELPVAFVLSGGPQLAARYSRGGNFSGSFWTACLPWFDDDETREALVMPAADRGVEFEEEALALLSAAAGGSPIEVQRLGFAAWSVAAGSEVITTADALEALGAAAPEAASRAS
jgi:hypothetical protein